MDKFLNTINVDRDKFLKILQFLLMAIVIITANNYLIYLFKDEYFSLNYKNNIVWEIIISLTFLYLNSTIFVGYVLDIYNRNIFKIGFLYFGFHYILYNIFYKDIVYIGFILPFIFVMLYSIKTRKINFSTFGRLIFFSFIIMLFQYIELNYRSVMFVTLDCNLTMNYVQKLVIYLNNFILQITLYLIRFIRKDVQHDGYDREILGVSGKFIFRIRKKSTVQKIHEEVDDEFLQWWNTLTFWQKVLANSYLLFINLAQAFIIIKFCFMNNGVNKILEVIFIFLGFWIARKILVKTFHFNSVWKCTIFSTVLFYLATTASANILFATFVPTIVGIITAILLYNLRLHLDDYNNLKDKKDDINVFK